MFAVVLNLDKMTQGISDAGQVKQAVIGMGEIFAQGVGGLGQVVVAVVEISGGVVFRVSHSDHMVLAVIALDAFLAQGVLHTNEVLLLIKKVDGLPTPIFYHYGFFCTPNSLKRQLLQITRTQLTNNCCSLRILILILILNQI